MWYDKTAPPAAKSEDPPPVQPRPFRGDDGAAELVRALKARDWLGARPHLADPPNAERFAFRLVRAGAVAGLEQWIDDVVRSAPGDPLPLLVKGIRYVNWAWDARGSAFADQVDSSVWPIWFERLSVAEDALQSVVQAQPGNAEAWHWLIVLGRARQVSKQELWNRYHGLVAADPTNYYGHTQNARGPDAQVVRQRRGDVRFRPYGRGSEPRHPPAGVGGDGAPAEELRRRQPRRLHEHA